MPKITQSLTLFFEITSTMISTIKMGLSTTAYTLLRAYVCLFKSFIIDKYYHLLLSMVNLGFMRSEHFGNRKRWILMKIFFLQKPIANDWTVLVNFPISTVAKLIMIKQRSEKSCWLIVLKLHEKSH